MHREMSVFARLMAAFSFVVMLLVGIGSFSSFTMHSLDERVKDLRENWLPGTRYSLLMQSSLYQFRADELEFVMASDDEQRDKYLGSLNSVLHEFQAAEALYVQHLPQAGDQERDTYADLKRNFSLYLTQHAALVDLARQLKTDEAMSVLHGPSQDAMNVINHDLSAIVQSNVAGADEAGVRANAAFIRSTWLEIILVIAAALSGLALAWLIARGLARQLGGEPRYALEIADQIARGDLNMEINLRAGDDASVLAALSRMKGNLTTMIEEIQSSCRGIVTATGEIAQGNAQLAQRNEEQAASLEQSAASVEQLTATVKNNTSNVRHLSHLADGTLNAVNGTGQVVQKIVVMMQDIAASSKKIGDIIGVIEGLAFQTNILSLNAAVESARAGEHGRGFAVVASEVRMLAQRSASAAKEINELIRQSADGVRAGVELVEHAGVTMAHAVGEVQRVTQIIDEVNSAAGEQSAGIEQINIAISHIDQMTQKNTSLVESTHAASSALDQQGQRLSDVVSIFRTRG